ncbi:MAG TPA: HlyD family efflux transporter periplasmic adaptor subunit, partial [Spirochaetia bacterium]
SALASAQKNYDSQKALYNIGGISASQLDTANSQLQQAQANLEAAKTALDQNAKSSTQTLAQLKLAIDQSQVQLQIAQLNLQNASIRAPFAGQIAAIQVNPGTYVSLNTPGFVLVSAEREIDFNVPPSDAPTLPVGSPVTFSYMGKDYAVKVSQAPSAPINGVVPMVAALPKSLSLPYGGVGTVSYSLSLARGAIVPIGALQVNEDQNYVYEILDGKAAVKQVTILAESGTSAAVAGLSAGDLVIVNAPAGLLAGSAVQAVNGTAGQDGAAAGGAPSGATVDTGAKAQPAAAGAPSAGQGSVTRPAQGGKK